MYRKLLVLTVLLLALVAGGSAWAAPAAQTEAPEPAGAFLPGDEPNDTFATATPMANWYEGYLMTPTDVDFLRVEFDHASRLDLSIYLPPWAWDAQPRLRVELSFYNGAQTLLAQDVDCVEPEAVLPTLVVPPGVYYVRLRACPGLFDSDQRYQVNYYSLDAEWEPNNSRATATPWGDIEANISPAGDVDFYSLEGTAGQRWLAGVESYDEGFPVPEAALLAADGTVLGYPTNEFTLPADGVYYVRVRSATHPTGVGDYRIQLYPFVDDDTYVEEIEPNNTPAQGQLVTYNVILSGQAGAGDVDHFRFNGAAGDSVALTRWDGRQWDDLTLYDPAMQPVPLSGPNSIANLSRTGLYTIAKSGPAGDAEGYNIYFVHLTGDEPANDTQAGAELIAIDQLVEAAWDYPCDEDWYRFQGRAGDVFPIVYPRDILGGAFFWLYAPDGTLLDRTHVLPADGTYYLRVLGEWWTDDDGGCLEGPYSFTAVTKSLWVSARVDGLGGAANKRGDILVRNNAAGSWRLVFDASDVGITRNVVAFDQMPNGSILMSLDAAQNVPGLGQVTPQDIIRFAPTSLGANTAGSFLWYLDGSDVGLTTAGEKIDAIIMQPDVQHPLLISLSGAGSVPRASGGNLTIADEDLINFVGAAYGANSAGAWRVNVDGSTVPGMAAEDLFAAERLERSPARLSRLLWGFDSAFTVNGAKGTPKDVLYGDDGLAAKNLAAKPIDAIAIGPSR